jgi:lycopene beta-cyclase
MNRTPASRCRVRATPEYDYVLVGGGLANSLLALAIAERLPGARVAVVERDAHLGGNHRWAFHAEDVPPSAFAFVEPLLDVRWPAYTVRFPAYERVVHGGYASLDSARLDQVVRRALKGDADSRVFTGAAAASITATDVQLQDGRRIRGKFVVDARGPERFQSSGQDFRPRQPIGYQKFVGLELELRRAHGLDLPIVMDATVPQVDGFRFFYVLPLSSRRLLVEDTYFSDSPELNRAALSRNVLDYCAEHRFMVDRVTREEAGVLPLPGRMPALPELASPLRAGYQGGWFHPTTGYSFPSAVRLAEVLAPLVDPACSDRVGTEFRQRARDHTRQVRFFTALNRLLFGWFAPEDRWHVLERFYRLPEPVIHRFYAMTTSAADRARILCGRPPRGLSVARGLFAGAFA